MAAKKPDPKSGKNPSLPWGKPGTPSTWICPRGHIVPRGATNCGSCS